MQSQASLPRHGASTEMDSQHTVHCASFRSPSMHQSRAGGKRGALASHLHSPPRKRTDNLLEASVAAASCCVVVPAQVASGTLLRSQRNQYVFS